MKRTNTLSSFWVKAVPVILLLACIGFTNANAQNYKPLNEAVTSVQSAMNALKTQNVGNRIGTASIGPVGTNGNSPTNNTVKVFEGSYFQRFLELVKSSGGVSAAMQNLDAQFPTNGQLPGTRNATISAARGELMHHITY